MNLSAKRPLFKAAVMPSGTEKTIIKTAAHTATVNVAGSALYSSVRISFLVIYETPKSKRAARFTHDQYCSGSVLSNPVIFLY